MRDALTMLELVPVGIVLSIAVITASAAYLVHAEPHQTGSAAPWLTKWVSWQSWWQHWSFPAC